MEIVFDPDKCSGCRTCQVVCAMENFNEVNPSKAALNIEGKFPKPGKYSIQMCDQCGSCAEVCMAEAIYKEDDSYRIDEERCINCLMCVMACPNGALFEHKDLDHPIKCNFCGECIEFCPRGALNYKE